MHPFVAAQYVLPKRLLTRMAGSLASYQGEATQSLIRRFVARYQVDMSEAANPDIASYATFNDFFTRALREGARPLADAPWLCPVSPTSNFPTMPTLSTRCTLRAASTLPNAPA